MLDGAIALAKIGDTGSLVTEAKNVVGAINEIVQGGRATYVKSADTTFTIAVGETHVVTGAPTSLTVTLAAPEENRDTMYSLIFTAGSDLDFTDIAPDDCLIVWSDSPDWADGSVYEITYHHLMNGVISARYSETLTR